MMSSMHSYTFDNLTRYGDDICGISERALQSSKKVGYMTTNYSLADCGMKAPINFATKQPNVFFKGGVGSNNGAGGCGVDIESKLKRSSHTNCPSKLSLQPRQYLTVPYLGRGSLKSDLEHKLIQGTGLDEKSGNKQLTEKSHRQHDFPMVNALRENIQNPQNIIETDAHGGWVRGGIPSRQLAEQVAFKN